MTGEKLGVTRGRYRVPGENAVGNWDQLGVTGITWK